MKFLCFSFVVVVGAALNFADAFPKSRPGYYPRSYMIGGSFYTNPRNIRQDMGYEYLPPGQMTAMVVGDTVATSSYSGSPYSSHPRAVLSIPASKIHQEDLSEQVTEPDSINETEPELVSEESEIGNGNGQETLFSVEDGTTETAIHTTKAAPVTTIRAPSPTRKIKIGKANRKPFSTAPPKPVETEEEEDELEDDLSASWPFSGSRKANNIPAYNAFFPIFINGGSPAGRSRTRGNSAVQEDGSYPGSATAIANSFSTGKGGVATSHATAFGDPYAAAMLRNAGLFNIRTKSSRKLPLQEEIDE